MVIFDVDLTVTGAAAPSELSADLGTAKALIDPRPIQQSRPVIELLITSKALCVVRDSVWFYVLFGPSCALFSPQLPLARFSPWPSLPHISPVRTPPNALIEPPIPHFIARQILRIAFTR